MPTERLGFLSFFFERIRLKVLGLCSEIFLLVSTRCQSGMKGGRAKTGLVRDPTTKEQVIKYEFTLLQSITFHFSWIFILIKIRFLFFLLWNPWSYLHNWKLRSDGSIAFYIQGLVSTLRLGRFRQLRAERTWSSGKKILLFIAQEASYSEPSSQVNEIWRWQLKLPFLGNSKIMVDPQWNSKVQRSNAIRFTAKQTIDETSRSGPGRTIIGIGDFWINFEVNKMRNYSGAAMAPFKVSLVSGVRSMRIPSHQFSPESGWAGVLSKRNPS